MSGRHNLPVQRAPLIGRDVDREAALRLLVKPETGMVTLTGPPGSGKTSLALDLARNLVGAYRDGVFFVGLAPIANADLVTLAIAQTLGAQTAPGQSLTDALAAFLSHRELLLVLDNFEHVVAASPLVAELLAICPGLKVLVTSRAALHLREEREYLVPPLALPRVSSERRATSDERGIPAAIAASPAVELFCRRATAVQPDFRLTPENAPAVAAICVRLDGLPLAIELAAPRARLLPPAALLTRLGRSLDLLTDGARDLPARQQTLRNAIAWSYGLLSPAEQMLLRRLAIFAGGCTLEAAEAVAGAEGVSAAHSILGLLASLVGHSLVRQESRADGEPRFLLLETIREFALEQLAISGETEHVGLRHAFYVLALAEEAEPYLDSAARGAWLGRLNAERDNIRAAMRWMIEHDEGDAALRTIGALFHWYWGAALVEGNRWAEAALALPSAQHRSVARAKALGRGARTRWMLGDYRAAQSWAAESVALSRELGDRQQLGSALPWLGLTLARSAPEDACALGEESVAIFRVLDRPWDLGANLNLLGAIARETGDLARARSALTESVAIIRALDDRLILAQALNNLGRLDFREGKYDDARSRLQECLPLHREHDDLRGVAVALSILGQIAERLGDWVQAEAHFRDALALYRDGNHRRGMLSCLVGLAHCRAERDPAEAVRLLGTAAALQRAVDSSTAIEDRDLEPRAIERLRAAMDEGGFATVWAEGQAMSIEQAIARAMDAASGRPNSERTRLKEQHPSVPGERGSPLPGHLSSREVEVLRLIAAGRSNREIADTLAISVNTVLRHITHIFAKTGVVNRAEAATYAHRHHLVE
jgi:predicted ATPase/DNA-binding CsgD family transcriptional regulator